MYLPDVTFLFGGAAGPAGVLTALNAYRSPDGGCLRPRAGRARPGVTLTALLTLRAYAGAGGDQAASLSTVIPLHR